MRVVNRGYPYGKFTYVDLLAKYFVIHLTVLHAQDVDYLKSMHNCVRPLLVLDVFIP